MSDVPKPIHMDLIWEAREYHYRKWGVAPNHLILGSRTYMEIKADPRWAAYVDMRKPKLFGMHVSVMQQNFDGYFMRVAYAEGDDD